MRDDVQGLQFLRLPMAGVSAQNRGPLMKSATPATPGKPSFAQELARAANSRAARPYVSPMKRADAAQPKQPMTSTRTAVPGTTASVSTASQNSSPRGSAAAQRSERARSLPETLHAQAARTETAIQQTGPLPLNAYPHPNGDNGRGMHWVPTTHQDNALVDRFVTEAQRMGVKWVTFLNNGSAVDDNQYLVKKLVGAGIEPVMRIYSPTIQPITGDLEGMVRHYVQMGVRYFQPYNEPNLNAEQPDGKVSVDRYLDNWLPAARAIVRGGGLPGFGSMAPGGDYDDQQFLRAALDGLKARGALGALDRAWLSMHNYTWNHPIQDRGDGDGFFKFRAYNRAVRDALGRDLPIIGTEGGTFEGEREDSKMAAVTAGMAADWTRESFRYMQTQREPWLFASSVWTVANAAAGGSDRRFEDQALFRADGSQSAVVSALHDLAQA